MTRFDCTFIGDLNPDMILRGDSVPAFGREVFCDDFYLTLGGSASICAGAFAGLGAKACFFGRAGDDHMGTYAMNALASCGVDISGVTVRKGSYSPVTVSLTSSQDRALITYTGTCGSLEEADVPVYDILARTRHIHIGSFFLQHHLADMFIRIFEAARRRRVTTSLDAGWDPTGEWSGAVLDLLRFTDIFFPNESEALAITQEKSPDEACRRLAEYCRVSAVKLGSRGSILATGSEPILECPICDLDEKYEGKAGKDFTGAGDTYNAGFIYAFLQGMSYPDCMRYGSAAAALRISANRRKWPFASLDEVRDVVES
ncbi:MAG: carbohydrate kinase family protein [Synergistaceae bacterium]|jgi:sugar/nucleoside kinase (ribokinase family)|nr:carbohydrate kinase family protein [Synergistaceae bacterium]